MKACALFLLTTLPLLAFAQLVPLELDQTITLPTSSPIWDVMPHPDGYFLWVQAVQPDTAATTRVYWGKTDSVGVDSFDLAVGVPLSVICFWRENSFEPCVVLSSSYLVGDFDSTLFCVYRLSDATSISPTWNFWTGTWPWPTGGYTDQDFRMDAAIPVPPPPQASMRVAAVVGCDHHWWEAFPGFRVNAYTREAYFSQNMMTANSFDPAPRASDLDSWSVQDTTLFLCISYGDHQYTTYSSGSDEESWFHESRLTTLPLGNYEVIAGINCQYNFVDPNECDTYSSICTFDSTEETAILFTRVDSQFGAVDSSHYLWRWTAPGMYDWWTSLNVVSTNSAEEFLCYDSTRHVFDVLGAADGHNYGVTDTITLGSEPRIIGRYDSTSRRLVFRVGNQLKLYRFGEYLAADDGQRQTSRESYALSAYPNPFNPTTQITFVLPKAGKVQLDIFDVTGRRVRALADKQFMAGDYSISFDGAGLPSGIYFARLEAGAFVKTQKLLLIK